MAPLPQRCWKTSSVWVALITSVRSPSYPIGNPCTPKDPIGSHEKLNCFSLEDMGHDPLKIDVVGTFMVDVDITYGCCLNSLHMFKANVGKHTVYGSCGYSKWKGTPEEPNLNGIFLGLAPTDKVMIIVGLLRGSGLFFKYSTFTMNLNWLVLKPQQTAHLLVI